MYNHQDLHDKIVEEPGGGDCRETDPVTTENQQVRNFTADHSVLLIPSRLLHAKSPDQDSERRDYAKAQRKSPHGTKVVLAEYPEED